MEIRSTAWALMLRHRRIDIMSIYGVLYNLQKIIEPLKSYLTLVVIKF